MNKVLLTGNLVANPEKATTKSGKEQSSFSIAINEGYGEGKTTFYVNVKAWDKLASYSNGYLRKGSRVLIEGRLSISTYLRNGVQAKNWEIIASSIEGLNRVETESKPLPKYKDVNISELKENKVEEDNDPYANIDTEDLPF